MDRTVAKELLHIQGWLDRVAEIGVRGKHAYLADDLLQEAGDSLMMKLGKPPTGCRSSTYFRQAASTGHSR